MHRRKKERVYRRIKAAIDKRKKERMYRRIKKEAMNKRNKERSNI